MKSKPPSLDRPPMKKNYMGKVGAQESREDAEFKHLNTQTSSVQYLLQ